MLFKLFQHKEIWKPSQFTPHNPETRKILKAQIKNKGKNKGNTEAIKDLMGLK